jgi:predicted branched-subunit amino acid permease
LGFEGMVDQVFATLKQSAGAELHSERDWVIGASLRVYG